MMLSTTIHCRMKPENWMKRENRKMDSADLKLADLRLLCSLGQELDQETKPVISPDCRLEKRSRFGWKVVKSSDGEALIVVFVAYVLGSDPSIAQFDPDSLRTSAAIMFAEKILQPFPPPKPGQRIEKTAHRGDVTFDVPKLWHARIAVERQKKLCQIRCYSAHKAQKSLINPCSFWNWNLLVFSFFSSGLFNKTIQFSSGTVCVASVLF